MTGEKATKYVSGTYPVTCSIRPYKGASEQKTITLNVHLDNVPIKDVVTKALRSVVISWQNGPGRSKFNTWKDHGTVNIDFVSPGKKVETREEKIEKLKVAFMKAGIDEQKALELATKAVDNPETLNE